MKWFLAGLGVGVALGIVIAPARGEETRRQLGESASRKWDDMSDEARTTLDEMRRSDWARQARDRANQARQQVSEVAGRVRETADRVRESMDRVTTATGVVGSRSEQGDDM